LGSDGLQKDYDVVWTYMASSQFIDAKNQFLGERCNGEPENPLTII
jgi:hypothetical protein